MDTQEIKYEKKYKEDGLLFPKSIPLPIYFYNNKNYTDVRRSKLMMFGDCLSEYDDFKKINYSKKIDILKYLERGCYNQAIKKCDEKGLNISWNNDNFALLYHDICYKVAMNIDPESYIGSDYLANLIISESIEPKKVAKMTSQEMCPEKYTEIFEKIKIMNESVKIKTSRLYYCGKCKRNETILSRCYNRSGDENNSLVCSCIFCGYQWTIAG